MLSSIAGSPSELRIRRINYCKSLGFPPRTLIAAPLEQFLFGFYNSLAFALPHDSHLVDVVYFDAVAGGDALKSFSVLQIFSSTAR